MSYRVLLICHSATAATRSTAFPRDEPLEAGATAAVAGLRERLAAERAWAGKPVITGPELRCRQSAELLGRPDGEVDRGLADWNLGRWAGLRLDDLAQPTKLSADADTSRRDTGYSRSHPPAGTGPSRLSAVEEWITQPSAAPHGGEPLTGLLHRVAAWLDDTDRRPEACLAITHPAVLRAAVVHALGAGPAGFWRIDAGPLATADVRGRPGRWSLRL